MRRIYHHWKDWECVPAGMYNQPSNADPDDAMIQYAAFLKDTPRFESALDRVLKEWPISCEQFLSNISINRIAWLGQASMCIETGFPRAYRAAFMRLLTTEEQRIANATANRALHRWLRRPRRNPANVTTQLELYEE